MGNNKRIEIKKILADPELRRRLMVSTIQATQAREGIHTTEEQARRAYYVVSEGEKTAFFGLEHFAPKKGSPDRRHEQFVRSINGTSNIRVDVPRRDFSTIEGSPLAYDSVARIAPLFRSNPPLQPGWGIAQRGAPTAEDERLVRFHWEVSNRIEQIDLVWEPFSKGGEFCRFYYDVNLRVAWSPQRRTFYNWYGRPGRQIERPESLDLFFQSGLTWPRRTQRGFNVRVLPSGCVFSDKSGFVQASNKNDESFLLAILNSEVIEYVLRALMSFGSYEVGVVKKLPVPRPTVEQQRLLGQTASSIYSAKAAWDEGNETSTRFKKCWLLKATLTDPTQTISDRLAQIERDERQADLRISEDYARLNDEAYRLYGISAPTQKDIKGVLGERPPETVWPQMEGRTAEQKRMEHVWRLLSHALKSIVQADEDGIVPFVQVSDEAALMDRLHAELAKLFSEQDVTVTEIEIANELKRKVKGYDRVEGIQEWIENVYFDYHVSLYKNRPVLWHIASSQGKKPAAFAVLIDYRRFGKEQMARLRGRYLREAIGIFRREAALAAQEGRAEDRLDLQAKVEEAEELDRRLQRIQEGFHKGGEDYRILTPWKSDRDRPKGWDPDINDGVKVNIEPLQRAGVLRISEVV
jgi:hypothetical protein